MMVGVLPEPGDEAMIAGSQAPDGIVAWLTVTSVRTRTDDGWATLIGTWPGSRHLVQVAAHIAALPVRRKPEFTAPLLSRRGRELTS